MQPAFATGLPVIPARKPAPYGRAARGTRPTSLCARAQPQIPDDKNHSHHHQVQEQAPPSKLLLLRLAAAAARPTLTAAALSLSLSLSLAPLPASAAFPDTPPDSLFFDEAGIVARGQAGLAEKALAALQTRDGFTVRFVLPKALPYGETPAEYAKELFDAWAGGPADVVIVGGVKVARAGVFAGEKAAALLTPTIAESLGNDTYAVKAGEESYGGAVLDVNNRLISVLDGEKDPGPPVVNINETIQNFKTKSETQSQRGKYIKVVGAVLAISFIAPIIQTLWYIK
jgi:uncharacterized protein